MAGGGREGAERRLINDSTRWLAGIWTVPLVQTPVSTFLPTPPLECLVLFSDLSGVIIVGPSVFSFTSNQ